MRDIEKVINDILDIVPDSFRGKEELKTRLDYVIDDSKYRSPELMFICWQDAHIILNQILMPVSLKTRNWIWADDIFELFSDGKWGRSSLKIKNFVYV